MKTIHGFVNPDTGEEIDLERAVKCIEACAGMDDPQVAINQMAYERDKAKQERNKAEAQRDELLEALKMAAAVMTACDAPEVSQKTVRELIAKMKGINP
jgi:hypothetical protein